jgi:F-type H+-transporting ATPase subunit b
MDDILHQLAGLVLGAAPTALLFIVLVLAYRFLVYGPLTAVLAERRERTQGAVEKANAAIAAADARSQEYEARLRAARSEIFGVREQRMQRWNAERERAVESARQSARERVHTARAAIDAQVETARAQIEASIDQLAAQILKAILPADAPAAQGGEPPLKSSIRIRPLLLFVPLIVFAAIFSAGASAQASAQSGSGHMPIVTPTSDEQGNQNNVYRHSSAVQWIAIHLHVRVETAAKIFEDLNSGVLALIIVVFLVRKLPVVYRKHREGIEAQIVDARSATEQANERLTAVEERLSRLDAEIEAIRQQAEREGAQDEVHIKQALEDERRRIVESAEHEIDAAGVAAQRRLKQFAAELAIERATRDLHLTAEDDRVLVSDFGKKLNANLGKGGLN